MKRMAGFTLLELVVALAILAVLATLTLNGLGASVRMWDRLEARGAQSQEAQLAAAFLKRQIEQARPLGFSGAPDAMRFIAPVPAVLGAGGLYWFSVAVGEAAEGKQVVISHRLYQREAWERFGPDVADSLVVLRRLEVAEFSYLAASRPGASPAWLSRWERNDALPQLVRLRVRSSGGATQEWLAVPRLATRRTEN
jgi:general secretion pathway protein J